MRAPSGLLLEPLALLALLAALAGAWLLLTAPARHRARAAAARAEATLAQAQTAAAGAAVEVAVRAGRRDAAADTLAQETRDAIDHTPGAGLRLNPALGRAGLVRLCQRPAYRGAAACLRRPDPVEPQDAGSRR
jgi:hypothetical protein